MRKPNSFIIAFLLIMFSCQVYGQDKTHQKGVNKVLGAPPAYVYKFITVTPHRYTEEGKKPLFSLNTPRVINFKEHPMTGDRNSVKIKIDGQESDKLRTLSVVSDEFDVLSQNIEIQYWEGEKLDFDKEKVKFDSESKELTVELSIKIGVYKLIIPTSSGDVIRTYYVYR